VTRTCAVCSATYEAARSSSRYCSSSCRGTASKRRAAGLSEAFTEAGVNIPARPGHVRRDLSAFLADRGLDAHPLVSALLTVADRLDAGNDPLAGMATALRQVESTLAAILSSDDDVRPDHLDFRRLAHVVRKSCGQDKADDLAAVLDAETWRRLTNYTRERYARTPPQRIHTTIEGQADD
jgi:hypothetical protein